jgi:peptidoglycan-associated lipoprotein
MRTIKAVIITICCIFLTTACSKKIMPPEIEVAGSVSEETDFTTPSSPETDFGGTGESGFSSGSSADSSAGSSGWFSEEPVLENGNSASSGQGNNNFASSGQGNNSSGSFKSNPFGNSNSSGGNSGSSEAGIQESRVRSFEVSTGLKDIHFKFDKYDLDSDSKRILQENAEFLKSNQDLHVEIQGHSDERGTNNYNIALGERRAQSTKKYLVSQGVDSSNVSVISYGEEKPFCFSSVETCWFQNRRAHFMVSK